MVSVCQTETKMGIYTTNYNLFMPSIGEQGWGDLVNGNFTTIDTTMEGLNTRVGTLETETDAMKETLDSIDFNSDGSVNAGSATQLNKVVAVATADGGGSMMFSMDCYTYLLPPIPGVVYTGSIKYTAGDAMSRNMYYATNINPLTVTTLTPNKNESGTIEFAEIPCFIVNTHYVNIHSFTLT